VGIKHDIKSTKTYKLQKVGIVNLRLPIRVQREGVNVLLVPKITIAVNFYRKTMGVHMSKLQRSIVETINSFSSVKYLENIGKAILNTVDERMPFSVGEITFEFPYPLRRVTPVSQYEIREVHDTLIRVEKRGNKFLKYIQCIVLGNSSCRCAGHQQRSVITSGIRTKLDAPVVFRDLVEGAEKAFSSSVHSIVRTEDEKYMAKQIKKNPRFVEDLVRLCLHNTIKVLKKKKVKGTLYVKAVSNDSIHLSDVYCETTKEV